MRSVIYSGVCIFGLPRLLTRSQFSSSTAAGPASVYIWITTGTPHSRQVLPGSWAQPSFYSVGDSCGRCLLAALLEVIRKERKENERNNKRRRKREREKESDIRTDPEASRPTHTTHTTIVDLIESLDYYYKDLKYIRVVRTWWATRKPDKYDRRSTAG